MNTYTYYNSIHIRISHYFQKFCRVARQFHFTIFSPEERSYTYMLKDEKIVNTNLWWDFESLLGVVVTL